MSLHDAGRLPANARLGILKAALAAQGEWQQEPFQRPDGSHAVKWRFNRGLVGCFLRETGGDEEPIDLEEDGMSIADFKRRLALGDFDG